jgi:hypothetical protein
VIIQWDPKPYSPTNTGPADGESQVQTSPTLSVDVSHTAGQSMDVTFYDASDGSEIGTATNVASGSTASMTWSSLDPGTTYDWYAVADDGDSTAQSSTWSFTTSYPPSVDSIDTTDLTDDHGFEIEAAVSDPDGIDNIDSCSIEIDDGDGNTQSYSGTVDTSDGATTCTSDQAITSSDNANWGHTAQLTVEVIAEDEQGNTGQSTALHTFPNHAPEALSPPTFSNLTGRHAFNITAVAEDTDDGEEELETCTVYHSDGDGNSGQTTGTIDPDTAGQDQAACTATISIDDVDGYTIDDQISVYTGFSDRHGSTTQTSTSTNTFPNRPPSIHPPARTFPASPGFDDLTRVQVNSSDPEGDTITDASFTIWEHNEDTDRRIIHQESGSSASSDAFTLWNSSPIRADLEAGTYNYSVTISDGHATRTRSDTFLTLEAVSPGISGATLQRPDPWGIEKTSYRSGQSLQAWFTVQDFNGRTDLEDYSATLTGPDTTATIEDPTVENRVLNGYNLSLYYSIPGDAGTGTWDLQVEATDQDSLTATNTTTFTVQKYDTVTAELTYTDSREDITVDGSDAQQGIYDSPTFPYIVEEDGPILTGLIGYSGFEELGLGPDQTTFNLTQAFQDSTALLPAAEANIGDLEALEDEFTGSVFDEQGFLENAQASIAYGVSEEKTVRVEASFEDDEDITLRGFNGSLGTGTHRIAIQNDGTQDGTTVIEVIR